jgi:hypothetical protein
MTHHATAQGDVAMTAQEEADFEASRVPVVHVPQVLPFRKAKTFMQLYPVGNSDLWTMANANADAIADHTARIKRQNFLRDSTEYHRQEPELIAAATELGIDATALNSMFIAADQL